MVLDLLSDFISRLKNGYVSRKKSITVLRNKQILVILVLLLKLGYISGFRVLDSRHISVDLVYFQNQPAIRNIIRVSKPSNRIYVNLHSLQNRSSLVNSVNGFFILSTSKGIVTDVEAMLLGLGGEILFQVV